MINFMQQIGDLNDHANVFRRQDNYFAQYFDHYLLKLIHNI